MKESAHVFGQYDHLLGVCAAPQIENPCRAVGVLLLTPGMLHHVGPFRLHVALARRLSQMGFHSLRFCLSGIGESFGVGATGSSTDRAVDEARQAMDWMQKTHGVNRFITFGLCSGADDSVNVALADNRIVGTILMDGCGYRTRGFLLRKYLFHQPRKLFHRIAAMAYGGGLPCSVGWPFSESTTESDAASSGDSTLAAGQDIREFPELEQSEREFQTLVDRGVRMLLLYTGGVAEYFNGSGQLAEMFPKLRDEGKIDLRYYSEMDHVAKLAEDRAVVVGEVAQWVDQWFDMWVNQSIDRQVNFQAEGNAEATAKDREPNDCKPPILVTTELNGSLGFPVTSL